MLVGQKVLLWCDNQVVVRMVSRWSGPPDCHDLLLALDALLLASAIQLRTAYITSKLNFLADALSRGGAVCAPPTFVLDRQVLSNFMCNVANVIVVCSD